MNVKLDTRKHRVLVVDDYVDAAEVTCMLLSILGHDCRNAATGGAALDEAARFEPHIVILDIGLPDISGYDVARELRIRAAGRPLYLAAVTGWGQPEDRARALEAGFDQHVLKPTDVAKLRSILTIAEQGALRFSAGRLPARSAGTIIDLVGLAVANGR